MAPMVMTMVTHCSVWLQEAVRVVPRTGQSPPCFAWLSAIACANGGQVLGDLEIALLHKDMKFREQLVLTSAHAAGADQCPFEGRN